MIDYIQSTASQEVPPPYQFPDVTVTAFVWEAQMAPIQAYCDRYFNLGTVEERGFVYRPAAFWPYATLLFVDYPVMISSSRAPPSQLGGLTSYSDRGVVSQREVFVALPVMRYGATPTRLIFDTTLEWTLPFIVVDNPSSAVCGREMLGMGKLLAEIEMGEGEFPDSFRGSVQLPGWPTLEPGPPQREMLFLEASTAPTLPTFRGSPEQDSLWTLLQSREAGWFIDELVSASDSLETLSIGLLPTTMRMVSLKQFRDAARPDRALYQALVTYRSKYSNFANFKFYNEQNVQLIFHNTGSFDEILRVFLQLGPEISREPFALQPKAAYRFNADINFDEMRTIHTFPVDRGPGLPPVPASSDLVSRLFRPWRGFFARPHP